MTAVDEANPTAARRELAVYFRDLREQRKRSLEDLAKILDRSIPQASRLDTGARTFQPDDIETLADWYDLDDTERVRLLALAEETRRRAWWQQVELPDSYRTYIGMERRAIQINEYCSNAMPGLLQTREYAEAAIAVGVVDVTPETISTAADVRVRRQDVLERSTPPRLHVILDELVLARGVPPGDVMHAQVERLYNAAAEHDTTTVQVINFEYGMHPGPYGHLMILEMAAPLPDVVYFEDKINYADSADPAEIRDARRTWSTLQAVALNPRDSLERIERYLMSQPPIRSPEVSSPGRTAGWQAVPTSRG